MKKEFSKMQKIVFLNYDLKSIKDHQVQNLLEFGSIVIESLD